VAVDSVYCLSRSEAWRYKLAEKLYFMAAVRMHCDKQTTMFCSCFYFISLVAHARTTLVRGRVNILPEVDSVLPRVDRRRL